MWVVRAEDDASQEEGVLENNIIAIGWNELPDLTNQNDQQSFYSLYDEKYSSESEKSRAQRRSQVWSFKNDIKIGDIVVLPRIRSKDVHIGKVTGNYEYKEYASNIKHTRKVQWITKISKDEIFPELKKFLEVRRTVYPITAPDLIKLIGNSIKHGGIDIIVSESPKVEKTTRKRTLYVTNNFPEMLNEFQEIVKKRGKAYYAIRWHPADITNSEYPLLMYVQSKGYVVAIFKISKILNLEQFNKIPNKMSYRVSQKPDSQDSENSSFLELIETQILNNPFPINLLESYNDPGKKISYPQNVSYVIDIGIPETTNASKYFLVMGPWVNWEHSLNNTPILWGVKPDSSGTNIGVYNQLKKNDIVFFYVSRDKPSKFSTYGIFGVGKILRKCPDEKYPYWPDEIQKGEASWTYRFQIKPIKIVETDREIIWIDGLPNVKGLNTIKPDNPHLPELLDKIKNQWNAELDQNIKQENHFLIKRPVPHFPILTGPEIMEIFKSSFGGGINKSTRKKCIVLVNSLANIYSDEVSETDDIIIYTGEGQKGDQTETYGNLSVIYAEKERYSLFFFTEVKDKTNLKKRTHKYKFLGKVVYLWHYNDEEPDVDGKKRKVIKFVLRKVSNPTDLKPLKFYPIKEKLTKFTWESDVDFNKTTETISIPKEIHEKLELTKDDVISLEIDQIPIDGKLTSGYEIIIPSRYQDILKRKGPPYKCELIGINLTKNSLRLNDFTGILENNTFGENSKIISFEPVGDDLYLYGHGIVQENVPEKCNMMSELSYSLVPLSLSSMPFCHDPQLSPNESLLKEKIQKIFDEADYGISGQKSITIISILYWLSKSKFSGNLLEYLKDLTLETEKDEELFTHHSSLFSDYVLIFELYKILGWMKFELSNRRGLHIKRALGMNVPDGRLLENIEKYEMNDSLSNLSEDSAKKILYLLLQQNIIDKKSVAKFWDALYGDIVAVKCPDSVKKLIKDPEGTNDQKAAIQISRYIYDTLVSQFSNLYKTKPVTPKLKIPTKDELADGIRAIQEELLIDDSIIKEIVAHLSSGRHIILAGPVGTGKTRLAQLLPEAFWTENCGYYADVYTATADWSTNDVIGGLIPKLNPTNDEFPKYEIDDGCVTKTIKDNYDRDKIKNSQFERHTSFHKSDGMPKEYYGTWLVIDEFNRADIDKAFGQLFTALEYKTLKIPTTESGKSEIELPIPRDYRIIATLNTADKHFLFNLSDALKRRFAYVEIPILTRRQKEQEILLATKNALLSLKKDVSDDENLEAIVEVNGNNIVYKKTGLEDKFRTTYEVLDLIRVFKPLGTAILKSMFQMLIISEKMEISESLSNALNANLIPQLENVEKTSLQLLYEIILHNLTNYLIQIDMPEKYKASFESVLRYLDYDEKQIANYSQKFMSQDFESLKMEFATRLTQKIEQTGIKTIKESKFVNSIHELINQSEIV